MGDLLKIEPPDGGFIRAFTVICNWFSSSELRLKYLWLERLDVFLDKVV